MIRDEARAIVALDMARGIRSDLAHGYFEQLVEAEQLTAAEARLVRAAFVELAGELYERAGVSACAFCLCTEDEACEGGCSWIAVGVCNTPACLRAWSREQRRRGRR